MTDMCRSRLAKRRASRVVVSIFVNPTQFAPTEDFGAYPRTWKADIAKLAAEDVDIVWHPGIEAMYPEGFATRVVPEGLALAGDLGVKVIGSRTVRERDGLAMSSRNVYLSPEERQTAPALYRAMNVSAGRIRSGEAIGPVMERGAEMIKAAGFALDYFEVRHAETLAQVASRRDGPLRILVAARLGATRLIDNIAV